MDEPFDPSRVEAFHHLGWDLDDGFVRLRYALDDVVFVEKFAFPHTDRLDTGARFDQALDVLAVAAGTSYFKAAAPPVVTGVPSWLVGFTRDLYLHGLAEYAMANDLDPIRPSFEARVPGSGGITGASSVIGDGPALVAVGGGKDSIVTIESAVRSKQPVVLGSIRTHRAIDETAALVGLEHLVIDRVLDPRLAELNAHGARNGHVPVTAIHSCALAALAAGLGLSAVVMSNESSASVPIARHRGINVNHQWSKGLSCEADLGGLLPVPYFSLLRSLHEVEICRRFAKLPQYFDVVTSCNQAYSARGRVAGTRWCGDCPKCRFVFLGLAVFLDPVTMVRIFEGRDLLAEGAAADAYRAILGLGGEPPMECIGTTRESRWAMCQLMEHPQWRSHAVVRELAGEVAVVPGWNPLDERGRHRVPAAWSGVVDALS